MTKILVTGATGFLGNHVINSLLSYDCEVIATSIESHNDASRYSWYNKVDYVSTDLSTQDVDFYKSFSRPHSLIHLAWQGLPNYDNRFHLDINLKSSYSFLKNMIACGLKNVVVSGTCFEYGMQSGCLNEGMATNPSNFYAIAKDELNKSIANLKNEYDFKFTWTRLFYLYGDGQSPNSLLGQLKKSIRNKDTEFNMSAGDQIRDFIDVKEVADILARLTIKDQDFGIVNCCSGKPITVLQFVQEQLESVDYKIKLNLGYYPYSKFEPKEFWGDRTKLDSIIL